MADIAALSVTEAVWLVVAIALLKKNNLPSYIRLRGHGCKCQSSNKEEQTVPSII